MATIVMLDMVQIFNNDRKTKKKHAQQTWQLVHAGKDTELLHMLQGPWPGWHFGLWTCIAFENHASYLQSRIEGSMTYKKHVYDIFRHVAHMVVDTCLVLSGCSPVPAQPPVNREN